MAVVSVCEPLERADFPTLVLRGLVEIGHYEEELCLELGLSYWINHSDTRLDEAVPALLALRIALIRASGLDLSTEPVPFVGVNHRVDVVNLAVYLRGTHRPGGGGGTVQRRARRRAGAQPPRRA